MRNICKKAASLLLVTMILLSMVVTGVVAEAAAPTAVDNCESSGLWTTVLNFGFSDTTWLNAVDGVTVNGTAYTNQTISSFSSDTGIWCVGTYSFNGGASGDSSALKIVVTSDAVYPLTVEVTAAGYNKLTMEVAKTTVSYNDVYTATVKTPEIEPTTPPTEPEEPSKPATAPTEVSSCNYSSFDSVLSISFADTYSDWLNAITGVTANGNEYTKGTVDWSSSGKLWEAGTVTGATGREPALKLKYTDRFPVTITVKANGYSTVTLTVVKNGYSDYTATIGAVEEITYKAYAAETENGSVSLSASEGIKEGETVTVTVTPDEGYELDTLTVKTENEEVETKKVSETSYTFAMPAANVTVTAALKARSRLRKIRLETIGISTSPSRVTT